MAIYLVIGALIIFYLLPKAYGFYRSEKRVILARKQMIKMNQEIKDHTYVIKCFGGPCDGHTHEITMPERPPWYISPYLPTDDEGRPDEENRVGFLNNVHYYKPTIAFYQQMDDENYFFVRDITESELHKLVDAGDIPSPEPPDDTERG